MVYNLSLLENTVFNVSAVYSNFHSCFVGLTHVAFWKDKMENR